MQWTFLEPIKKYFSQLFFSCTASFQLLHVELDTKQEYIQKYTSVFGDALLVRRPVVLNLFFK